MEELTNTEILEEMALFHPTCDKYKNLVLWAEVTEFTIEQKLELEKFLFNFIKINIGTFSEEIQTYVCSAIRKYVGIIDNNKIDSIIDFITKDSSISIKLEVMKMIKRKFIANRVAGPDHHEKLAREIQKILLEKWFAVLHLKFGDEEIEIPKYANAATMNGIQALIYMGSKHIYKIIPEIKSLPSWFTELLIRRLKEQFVKWSLKPLSNSYILKHVENVINELERVNDVNN